MELSPAARRLFGEESAASLVESAVLLPVFIVLLLGAVDFGRAWYINLEIAAASEAGALYGVQNPLDTAGMQSAAALDAADISSLATTAVYGSECSDGTSVTAAGLPLPVCLVNTVTWVEVGTSIQYKPYFVYPGMGATWTLSSKTRLRTQ